MGFVRTTIRTAVIMISIVINMQEINYYAFKVTTIAITNQLKSSRLCSKK